MKIIKDARELKKIRKTLNGNVGFVPTMGALHDGHLSLIQRARKENDFVIVSIFVNPTQFLEGEDLEKYPRKEKADIEICIRAGVDILFMPEIGSIYFEDELKILAPKIRGFILEGAKRPGHFDGVLQVVLKLFHIVSPTKAYFGKKDAQQLALITQMVHDYFLDVEVIPCEIVRDENGLALSSRNAYLSAKEKQRALALSSSLKLAANMVSKGIVDTQAIKEAMQKELLKSVDKLDYVAIVNRAFEEIKQVEIGNSIILVAAYVGTTRLIDNIWI